MKMVKSIDVWGIDHETKFVLELCCKYSPHFSFWLAIGRLCLEFNDYLNPGVFSLWYLGNPIFSFRFRHRTYFEDFVLTELAREIKESAKGPFIRLEDYMKKRGL